MGQGSQRLLQSTKETRRYDNAALWLALGYRERRGLSVLVEKLIGRRELAPLERLCCEGSAGVVKSNRDSGGGVADGEGGVADGEGGAADGGGDGDGE